MEHFALSGWIGTGLEWTVLLQIIEAIENRVTGSSRHALTSTLLPFSIKKLAKSYRIAHSGNTRGGCITVPLPSCLTGLDQSVLQIKTKIFSCHKADSKPVKQEVNGTVILPLLVFPGPLESDKQEGTSMTSVQQRPAQLRLHYWAGMKKVQNGPFYYKPACFPTKHTLSSKPGAVVKKL